MLHNILKSTTVNHTSYQSRLINHCPAYKLPKLNKKTQLIPTSSSILTLYSLSSHYFASKSIRMSATHQVLTDETQYQTVLESSYTSAKDNNQQLYVYITGAVNPDTGLSWCPDCTATFDNLNKLKVAPGNFVLECPVERTKYRGIPAAGCEPGEGCKIEKHPYKTNEKLQLKAIPTLFKVNMADFNAPYESLVEAECYNNEKFNTFTGL